MNGYPAIGVGHQPEHHCQCSVANRRLPRRGLTLIELLVSALLAALMLTALTSVVWSSARDLQRLRRQSVQRFPSTQLVDMMRTDFTNSRGMLVDPRGITLHGFLGADPSTHQPLLTPGRVRYEVVPAGNHGLLVRTGSDSREPIWFGCSSVQIESLDQVGGEDRLLPSPESGGLPPVPTRFRVTIRGIQGQVIWQEMIRHHED